MHDNVYNLMSVTTKEKTFSTGLTVEIPERVIIEDIPHLTEYLITAQYHQNDEGIITSLYYKLNIEMFDEMVPFYIGHATPIKENRTSVTCYKLEQAQKDTVFVDTIHTIVFTIQASDYSCKYLEWIVNIINTKEVYKRHD